MSTPHFDLLLKIVFVLTFLLCCFVGVIATCILVLSLFYSSTYPFGSLFVFFSVLCSLSPSLELIYKQKAALEARARALGEPTPSAGSEALARPAWRAWLARWLALAPNATVMRSASPKFVPREWMLAAAYKRAGRSSLDSSISSSTATRNHSAAFAASAALGNLGDFSEIHRLQELFRYPYDEQSADMEKRYYRLPPLDTESQGGIGFMS